MSNYDDLVKVAQRAIHHYSSINWGPKPRVIDLQYDPELAYLYNAFLNVNLSAVDYTKIIVYHSNGLSLDDVDFDRICAYASLTGTTADKLIMANLPVTDIKRKVLLVSSL